MFEEAAFEDEEVVTNAPHQCDERARSSTKPRRDVSRGSATHTVHFHRPGDDGFCAVAGAGEDTSALLDARTISGDSWVTSECHCTRCECLKVMGKLEEADRCAGTSSSVSSRQPGDPLILLLLDLDNFGFNQFKSVAPGGGRSRSHGSGGGDSEGVDPLDHLFVWAFFGSCFTRYHRAWPTTESVSEALPNSHSNRPTIWQRLVAEERVHFTPCAGQSQAADSVIMKVLEVFAERHVVLLTGDTKLIAEIATKRRRAGRKSRRDNEMDMMADRLTLIDVNENDKRFVPVWRDLELRVIQTVLDNRGFVVEDEHGPE